MSSAHTLATEPMLPDLEDKVGFLSLPESYREHTRCVCVLQTSHAWLFMTDRHVYKLKKPSRRGGFDYSTLESRHELCLEEVRLNRRLSKHTYLGVIPLVINAAGNLELDAAGHTVEWLVKMNRLPESRSLLAIASTSTDHAAIIERLMSKLLRFYAIAPICHLEPGEYAQSLQRRALKWRTELLRPQFAIPALLVTDVTDKLNAYITANAQLLEERHRDRRVREIHGDLRPEHVFFIGDNEPEIIDCLEFDVQLRRLDCAEEIAFLGMECRQAGLAWIERGCIDNYTAHSGDTGVPEHLWRFYGALGATIRAGLSAWHRLDGDGSEVWSRIAINYLQLALDYDHPAPVSQSA